MALDGGIKVNKEINQDKIIYGVLSENVKRQKNTSPHLIGHLTIDEEIVLFIESQVKQNIVPAIGIIGWVNGDKIYLKAVKGYQSKGYNKLKIITAADKKFCFYIISVTQNCQIIITCYLFSNFKI